MRAAFADRQPSMLLLIVAFLGLFATAFQTARKPVEYFPPSVFSPYPDVDDLTRNWFSKVLREADEPSLWEDAEKQGADVYRFTWLRSFHQPITVRLVFRPDGSADLVAKVMSGEGGYDPGHLITNDESHLVPVEAKSFLEKLQKADFWNLPATRPHMLERDGAEWIMEGVKKGKYRVVVRWSPRNGDYRDACLYLALGLANLRVPDPEIY